MSIKRADELWSLAVITRDKRTCQICGKFGDNPHHIKPRANKAVRHDLDNGVTLCSEHHTIGDYSAHRAPMWFINRMAVKKGAAWYYNLEKRARVIEKPDYQERIKELKEYLKLLEIYNGLEGGPPDMLVDNQCNP